MPAPRVLAALLALTVLTVACGGGDTVDPEDAAGKVSTVLATRYGSGVVDDVMCPDDVQPEAGERFVCTAVVEGQDVHVTVRFVDDDGGITSESVQPREAVIDAGTMEDFVEDQYFRRTGEGASAECTDKDLLVAEPGAKLDCRVETGADARSSAVVTVENARGKISVEFSA